MSETVFSTTYLARLAELRAQQGAFAPGSERDNDQHWAARNYAIGRQEQAKRAPAPRAAVPAVPAATGASGDDDDGLFWSNPTAPATTVEVDWDRAFRRTEKTSDGKRAHGAAGSSDKQHGPDAGETALDWDEAFDRVSRRN